MIDYREYITEIEELSAQDIDANKKLPALSKILERLSRELTKEATIQFSNLFSRIVFIAQRYQLPKQLEWRLQHLRIRAKKCKRKDCIDNIEYDKHKMALLDFICFIESHEYDDVSEETIYHEMFPEELSDDTKEDSKNHLRVQIKEIDKEHNKLICIIENSPGNEVVVFFNVPEVNDILNSSVEQFWEGAQLNLIDCKKNKKGELTPKLIVLEPDYLIDASAVAECFHDFCVSPMHYFRNKFETIENRSYILMGNLANYFLDELVYADDIESVSFENTFLDSFKQLPFEYTSCQDIASHVDFVEYMNKAQKQFINIKRVVSQDLPKSNIKVQNTTLEPSFFSEKYGFQGRLDMLQHDREHFRIVELKSGKLPYPAYNIGKIALNHEVQTTVYRFMIESVFGIPSRNMEAAILYSAGDNPGTNLRFAAEFQKLDKEIINMRNHIVANEHKLMNGDNDMVEQLFEELYNTVAHSKKSARFYGEKIENFKSILKQCSEVELSYFYRYIRFISRELYLQKIGDIDYETPTGVAALWNSDFMERAEALEVFYDLTIESIDDSGNDMLIVFRRNQSDNEIVNFREGEMCIVYPRQDEGDTVLNRQILKGSIALINSNFVEIRFRHKQRNRSYFDENKLWAVEHDTLDTSYNSMFKGLFNFLNAATQKRNLLLGIEPPKSKITTEYSMEYPENIISKAMAAEDYFLIVGPPGTGKTSIFARRLIEEYYSQPETNVLILAYTNRAVDELCDTINAAMGCEEGNSEHYIRIGTRLSCSEPYRDRLLQNISERATSRDELRNEIDRTRIFVSTLASINGKQELFALKKFDVAIIDEASQILEPQIIGLLPNFNKFIMIGDHNQLPAIVLQKNWVAAIQESELKQLGINSCACSLFERLLQHAISEGWQNAFVQLTRQGRMHNDIAAFPSEQYYVEDLLPVQNWQSEPWQFESLDNDNLFQQTVSSQRVAFFSTERMEQNMSNKVNENEADIVMELVASLQTVYNANGRELSTKDIGIITPYRNQIALIRHKLSRSNIENADQIMVDTVERFQGSQRNIIIVSFCINKPYQMNFLCNLNDEGTVDRKLNVTLTRARQQMFLIGNATILKRHPIYATLLEHYKNKTIVL